MGKSELQSLKKALENISGKKIEGQFTSKVDMLDAFNKLYESKPAPSTQTIKSKTIIKE